MSLPNTPFFYVGIYILIGVLFAAWDWKKTSSGRMHSLARQRFGHLADTMLIAPIILWPLSLVFMILRMLRLLPTSWNLRIKDRACKCGGEYRTNRTLADHAGLVGKLIVKCWTCKEISELWGAVEIEDLSDKPKEGGGT